MNWWWEIEIKEESFDFVIVLSFVKQKKLKNYDNI